MSAVVMENRGNRRSRIWVQASELNWDRGCFNQMAEGQKL